MTNKFAAKLGVALMLIVSIIITLQITTVSKEDVPDASQIASTEVIIFDAEPTEPESTSERDLIAYYSMSDEEVELFAKLVYLESGSTSVDCQRAVASVVLNRITTQRSDLKSVVYAKGQFAVANKLSSAKYSDESLSAVEYVLEHGPTVPEYVTYFREGHYFNWGPDHKGYTNIDNVYFSYSTKLQEAIDC